MTARRHPRRRAAAAALALLAIGAGLGALLAAPRERVGHFTSAAGRAAYLAAYRDALREGPPPSGTRDVPTDAGIAHLIRYDGPEGAAGHPLVLLPGTQSGAPMWVDDIPALAEHRTVYVLDLIGQPGLSAQTAPIPDAAADAHWLAQVLRALPGGKPTVMGHSLGGWTAMNLAVHEPDAAAAIVVVDPVLTFADLSPQAVVRSIPASVPWTPRSWRDGFASWTANDAPVADEPLADMIEAGMQHYALGSPAPSRFSDVQLRGVRVPVLALLAGASRMHDAAAAAQHARITLRDARILTYPGASHAITGEQPARIGRDVDAFLTERGR
jgi:pimeloyl-ACP methyl ester carboxylesterase